MQTDQPVFNWRKLNNALYLLKRNIIQSSARANESSRLVNNVEYGMGEAFQMSSFMTFSGKQT